MEHYLTAFLKKRGVITIYWGCSRWF